MSARITDLRRPRDFDDTVSKLMCGDWLVFPYETYGQLDRAEWNTELVAFLAEHDVRAEVIDVPKKNLVIVVNVEHQPTLEQLTESVAAVEHQRMTGHRP